MRRRDLLALGASTTLALFGDRAERAYAQAVGPKRSDDRGEQMGADLVIVGGGTGGCASPRPAAGSGLAAAPAPSCVASRIAWITLNRGEIVP